MDESREPVGDFDCPSLLCEELEGVEENGRGDDKRQDEEDGKRGGEGGRERWTERGGRGWEGDETEVEGEKEEGERGEEEKEEEEEPIGGTIEEGSVRGAEERGEEREEEREEERGEERGEDGEMDSREAAVTEKAEEEERTDFQKGDEQTDIKTGTFCIQSESGDVKETAWGGEGRDDQERERKFQDEILLELTSVNHGDPAESSAAIGPTCDLSDSGYLSCEPGLYCPPGPLLYPAAPQPGPSDTTHPASSLLPDLPPPPAPQPLQVKVTQVYATRHSVHFRARRRRGQALPFPMLPVVTVAESTDPAPQPKKKTRTLYSMDQLEQLESMFQEEHYPDAEKRKEIAAAVCVTPQRIMVWFQNRRAKWRKVERSSSAKPEHKPSRKHRSSPRTAPYPLLAPMDPLSRSVTFSGNIAPAPPVAPMSSPPKSLPSYSALLASLHSPTGRGAGPGGHQAVPQGGHGASLEPCPPPMVSPPPLQRASLPLFANYNPLNTAPPLHNPPTPSSSSFFLDMLESSSSLPNPDPPAPDPQGLSLQTESGSLFDYGEAFSHQSSSLSYQLQPSYQAQPHSQAHGQAHSQAHSQVHGQAHSQAHGQAHSQAHSQPHIQTHSQTHSQTQPHSQAHSQAQPHSQTHSQTQASLPRLTYLNPSPYLPPNPSDSNPTSYLTFGSGGGAGVVTYGGGGPAYFQSQSGGQIVLQSGPHGGIAAYQTYPWGEVYSQPGMFQRAACPQYTTRDHVPAAASSTSSYPYTASVPTLLPLSNYPRGGHGPSHPQRPATNASTSALPSSLRPPFSRADGALPKPGAPLVPHVSPALPEPPPEPPSLKVEYDSPREVHSHFQCDFSPIHF